MIRDFFVNVFNAVPNTVIVAGAVAAALGVLWRNVVKPFVAWVRNFKSWMARTENQLAWVEAMMKPNGGSSLMDKVNMLLQHDAERDQVGARYGVDKQAITTHEADDDEVE